jgi:hypothetical protein
MLDQGIREAMLQLHRKGLGSRRIAKLLTCSRGAVRDVIARNNAEVPPMVRQEKAQAHRDDIRVLYDNCKGNLVRVHEKLLEGGAELSYQALTAFCRRHQIGSGPKAPCGHFDFPPGKEMQHDTSPHRLEVGGKIVLGQTADLVLAYCRVHYMQIYPQFNRLVCKIFLQEGVQYFGGAAEQCMVDNTNVVRAYGSGANMVPAPEMAAFGKRFGFKFVAHEVGDADRSAYVERFFDYVENNFLAGRKFTDWDDVNRQARLWCDKNNSTFKRALHATPFELLAAERPQLKSLPVYIPEVYQVHGRLVDVEGLVSVHRHRYSVPYTLIDRQVQVRETKDTIVVYDGPRRVATHPKCTASKPQRMIDKTHRPERGIKKRADGVADEVLGRISSAMPEAEPYAHALKKRSRGRGLNTLRQLWRLVDEYPPEALLPVIQIAHHYGLYDLHRLERMILRHIAGDFFNLPNPEDDNE